MKIAAFLASVAIVATATTTMVAMPAQADSPSSKHHFGKIYSEYSSDDKGFGRRSYFKGYWYGDDGRYWFVGDLRDRDNDREYSYVWFRWRDDEGTHLKWAKTRDHDRYKVGGYRARDGFYNFDIKVCEGDDRFQDCGGWDDVY